jgi:hypothetical protein
MDSYFVGMDIRAQMTSRKFSVKKKVVHFSIPNSRRFLKTIEIFLKAIDNPEVILNIVRRLFHVHFFLQIPMQ